MSSEQMTSKEWRLHMSQKYANRYRAGNANALTNTIIQWLNWNGFVVWRNNTMGVFDNTSAAKNILSMIKLVLSSGKIPALSEIRKMLSRSYRKSHERKGVSDIIGYQKKTGRFVAVEVKWGKDKLSTEQRQFLDQMIRAGGIGIEARDMEGFLSDIAKYL